MQFSPNIVYRFKKDHNLPIPIHFKESFFHYYLDIMSEHLYPDVKNQWESMKQLIAQYGGADQMLERYAVLKDAVINNIKNSQGYEEFNTSSMPVVKNDVPSVNIFTDTNLGKRFVSIDLRLANFQTLRKYGVIPNMGWHEFIGEVARDAGFSDNDNALVDYVANSKYTRQVIFGQCNPKRTIAFEKVYIEQVRQVVDQLLAPCKLLSKNSDELIYEIPDTEEFDRNKVQQIQALVLASLGLEVRVQSISLIGVKLKTENGYTVASGYLNTLSERGKFKCVPEPYMPMFIEWYNAKEDGYQDSFLGSYHDPNKWLNGFDNFSLYSQYVVHDGVVCRIDEKMHIEVLDKN